MNDPVGARAAVVLVVLVASAALSVGFGAASLYSAPTTVCPWGYAEHDYCAQTLTISSWCPYGVPCPLQQNFTRMLGYTFYIVGLIEQNGTPGLAVTIRGAPGEGYGFSFFLSSDPLGAPVAWTSPDGLLLVSWPDPIPEWEYASPGNTTVIYGASP